MSWKRKKEAEELSPAQHRPLRMVSFGSESSWSRGSQDPESFRFKVQTRGIISGEADPRDDNLKEEFRAKDPYQIYEL